MIPSLAVILLLLSAGHACARWGLFAPGDDAVLNRFVIHVCLPAMILALVPSLRVRPEHLSLVAIPWALLLCSTALVLLTSRALGLRRDAEGAMLLCVGLGNTSFLGYPMVEALLGADALRLAVIYDQLGSFLMLSTFGLAVQARYAGAAAGGPSVARRLLTFPPFLALLLAVALSPWPAPPEATAALRRVGDALLPASLFAVGLRLRLGLPPDRRAFAAGLALKMGALPLLAWAMARALGASPEVTRVAVLESATPPMITAGAFAIASGLAPELAAALVGYGVLVAVASLPAWAAALR